MKKRIGYIVALLLVMIPLAGAYWAYASGGVSVNLGASSINSGESMSFSVSLPEVEEGEGYTAVITVDPSPGLSISESVGAKISGSTCSVSSDNLDGTRTLHFTVSPGEVSTETTYTVSASAGGDSDSASFTVVPVQSSDSEEQNAEESGEQSGNQSGESGDSGSSDQQQGEQSEQGSQEGQNQQGGQQESIEGEGEDGQNGQGQNGQMPEGNTGDQNGQTDQNGKSFPKGKMPSGKSMPKGSGFSGASGTSSFSGASGSTFSGTVSSGSTSSGTDKTTYQGSANNYLKKLKVKGYSFTQKFNKTRDTYFLKVDDGTKKIKVKAVAADDDATVVVSDNKNLKSGRNKVLVTVTAESGAVRTYRIIVDVA